MKTLALLLSVLAFSNANATDRVPVTIGSNGPEIDACPSLGELTKQAVLVAGPSSHFQRVTELKGGSMVHVCGTTKNGKWTSVVVAMDGVLDCKVSSPVPQPQFYQGPCISGWVLTSAVRIIAG